MRRRRLAGIGPSTINLKKLLFRFNSAAATKDADGNHWPAAARPPSDHLATIDGTGGAGRASNLQPDPMSGRLNR